MSIPGRMLNKKPGRTCTAGLQRCIGPPFLYVHFARKHDPWPGADGFQALESPLALYGAAFAREPVWLFQSNASKQMSRFFRHVSWQKIIVFTRAGPQGCGIFSRLLYLHCSKDMNRREKQGGRLWEELRNKV